LTGAILTGANVAIEDFRSVDLSGVIMPDGKSHPAMVQARRPIAQQRTPSPTPVQPSDARHNPQANDNSPPLF
jgi:hypothetical protein